MHVRRDDEDCVQHGPTRQHFDNPAYHVDIESGGTEDDPSTSTPSSSGSINKRMKAKISIGSNSSGDSETANVDNVMRSSAEGRKVEFTTISEDDPDGYFMARNNR